METVISRVVLAGTNSGCGKTTVSCAIMQALVNRGLRVAACKCGPDYIDPMFHSQIIGAKSTNLDPFFYDTNTLRYLLAQNAAACRISIIEGVMGYYDGMSMQTERGSTCDVARQTQSPVVLVVGARGAALSVLASIHGFLTFLPENRIAGVILNQCTAMTYTMLQQEILQRFAGRVKPLGYLPPMPDCKLESRHLGLIPAHEVTQLHQMLGALAQQAEKSIDLDALLTLADNAPKLCYAPIELPRLGTARIAVAWDDAFCFYYAANLQALRQMGAELVFFSPLHDKALPENVQGLYLGGGYPELHTQTLCENRTMKQSIRTALDKGLPCIAECGGFMYLTQHIDSTPMVGVLEGGCTDMGKLVRFGYVRLRAKHDGLLCKAGEEICAHEFHHWDCDCPGTAFLAEKPSGRRWDCAVMTDRLYAGYPHLPFYSNLSFAKRFYMTCLEAKS